MHRSRFCPLCAAPLTRRVPEFDNRERLTCPACGYVLYVNPKMAAGTIPYRDGKVALVQRGIEPGLGLWSWPCGYVEIDETVEDCAMRETREESALTVELGELLGVYSYPVVAEHGHTPTSGLIVMAWETTSVTGELTAGDDADHAQWYGLDEIPWDLLAFDSSRRAIRDFLARR